MGVMEWLCSNGLVCKRVGLIAYTNVLQKQHLCTVNNPFDFTWFKWRDSNQYFPNSVLWEGGRVNLKLGAKDPAHITYVAHQSSRSEVDSRRVSRWQCLTEENLVVLFT